MQEIELSNDLKQIEFEIKQYEEMAGKGIYEIGRRINWVKQNDLAHGEFLPFLKRVNISKSYAEMFMKIAKDRELGNSQPVGNLGISVLYELTRIPNDIRDKPQQLDSGETKKPVDMTRREIQELNRKLKESEDARKTLDGVINEKSQTINALEEQVKNKPAPEIVEKEIEKVPEDYEQLKQQASSAQAQLKKAQEDLEFYQKELRASERIRKNNEANDRFDKQQEYEQEHKLRSLKIQTATSVYTLVSDIQKFIREETIVEDISQIEDFDEESKDKLRSANDSLQRFVDQINQILNGRKIIEGKFSE